MAESENDSTRQAPKIGARKGRLESLKRKGNVLEAPTKQLKNLQFCSWINDGLPNILWAVLLAGTRPREEALTHFRAVLRKVQDHKEIFGDEVSLEHSRLSGFNEDQFDILFSDLCKLEVVQYSLSPLLFFENLPDRAHWVKLLPDPTPDHWNLLASAVAVVLDHQSLESTDCRWLKIMALILAEKLHLPQSMDERLEAYLNYPNVGDQKSVRGSIRALEMTTRPGANPFAKETPIWNGQFWTECWEKTECIRLNPDEDATEIDRSALLPQIISLHSALSVHFEQTTMTTAADPRHDGAFGLVFYILQLLYFSILQSVGATVQGRVALRSAVEAYITLAYLVEKDDPTIWLQYRNYGNGQAKLAYLKRLNLADAPSFINEELLEQFANEDVWIEYLDIKLGAWADKNLRAMAEQAGVKPFYDAHYDTLSGYVHANWTAVRHATFTQCANPLHRLHRIPVPPRLLNGDVVSDLAKICNLALDKIAHLFPSFGMRVKWKGKIAPAPK